MRRFASMLGMLSALLCALTAPAAAQNVDVTGVIDVVWGDPPSDALPPILRFVLMDDTGREHELDITDDLLALHGGIVGLNRKRVTVRSDAFARPAGTRLRVLALRLADAATPGEALLASASASISVSRPYVTILCRFADSATLTPYPVSHFETLMGESYPGVNHYWTENTENRINLNGSIVRGWYTLPSPRADYLTASGDANLGKLAIDCTAAADADVFFPGFSGINLQFNERLDCCSWGGSRTMTLDGVTRSYPMTWEADWAAARVGTYAHEVGHSLGLPHSSGPYGRVYDSRWDVMSASSWVAVAGTPYTAGAHTNSYHKNLLGAVPPARRVIATDSVTTIWLERSAQPRANSYAQMVQIPLAGDVQILYTVEARRRTGYDAPLPADAVVIHAVAPGRAEPAQVVDADGNGNTNDAGAMWTVGEVFRDLTHGIAVSVDSVSDAAFIVTVRRNAFAAVSVAPTFRTRTVTTATAVVQDSANIVGPAAPWQATTRSRRLRVTTPSGAGAGVLRWYSELSGLSPGLYVDTIRVTSGATAWPALLVDSLELTAPAATVLQLTASATSRADSLVVQRTGVVDSLRLRFFGPNAATAAWTATRSRPTTFFQSGSTGATTLSGTGDASIRWYHTAIGLSAGVYIDTLRITAAGAAGGPLLVIDTLQVYDAPVLTLVRHGRASTEVPEGAGLQTDSASVQLSGRWAAAGLWTVSNVRATAQRFLRPVNPSRTGNATFAFTRAPGARGPGTYVDTLRITPVMAGTAAAVFLVDTLVVTAAAPGIDLSWRSRRSVAWLGSSATADSVLVMVSGPGASTKEWRASAPTGRITLANRDAFTAAGVGNGTAWLRWHRSVATRGVGTYSDTIRVTLTDGGLTAQLVDTLQIVQVAANVSAPSRFGAALVGSSVSADSVRLELFGAGSATAAWTASARASWLRLQTTAGAGTSFVRWTRHAAGLIPGAYVDTIVVHVPSAGATTRVIDTLFIAEPVVVASDSLRTAAVSLAYRDSLRAAGGDGRFTWSIVQGALPAGIALQPQGVLQGAPTTSGSYDVTVRATSLGFSGTRALRLTVIGSRVVITSALLRTALMGAAYADTLRASGGDATIVWSLAGGSLPRGLTLDAASGAIAGVPEQAGAFAVAVRARAGTIDTTAAMTLQVIKPTIAEAAVVDHLLGASTLLPDQARFLDLLGNRNGRVDVGDVRAWLQDAGRIPAATSPLRVLLDTLEHKPPRGGSPERRQQ